MADLDRSVLQKLVAASIAEALRSAARK
jgi:hypothetical protein